MAYPHFVSLVIINRCAFSSRNVLVLHPHSLSFVIIIFCAWSSPFSAFANLYLLSSLICCRFLSSFAVLLHTHLVALLIFILYPYSSLFAVPFHPHLVSLFNLTCCPYSGVVSCPSLLDLLAHPHLLSLLSCIDVHAHSNFIFLHILIWYPCSSLFCVLGHSLMMSLFNLNYCHSSFSSGVLAHYRILFLLKLIFVILC